MFKEWLFRNLLYFKLVIVRTVNLMCYKMLKHAFKISKSALQIPEIHFNEFLNALNIDIFEIQETIVLFVRQ